jgi:Flp pilus assembly protein TadG
MLEMIVLFPVIAILLAAVIEFGLLLSGIKHVQASSRAGAKIASELSQADLGGADTLNVDVVKDAVDRVLSSAGFESCQVILENVTTGCVTDDTRNSGTCTGCNAPATTLPTVAVVPGGTVRVTVCVDADQLTPDLLSSFGFDISSKIISASTALPFENCP